MYHTSTTTYPMLTTENIFGCRADSANASTHNRIIKFLTSAVITILLFNCAQATASAAQEYDQITISVPPDQEYVVVDRLDGVEARYREGGAWTDETGTYSCAGFVTTYYKAVYGIHVNNLIDAGPPQPSDKLIRVDVPQKGDIIFYPSPPNKNNHSAIVKSFDGAKITLIEQNFKWAAEDVTYAGVNRTIDYPDSSYEIYRTVNAPISPPPVQWEETPSSAPVIALDELGLLSMLSFQFFTDIQIIAGQSPELIQSDIYDTGSFVSSVSYSFTIPADFELCLYYESMDNPADYKLAYPGESITAVSAIFKRPAAVVAAFAQIVPEPAYILEAIITIDSPYMLVSDVSVEIDSPAYIENGRTMMPVKWLSSALGIDDENIRWDGAAKTVTVADNGNVLNFTIGSNILILNGEQIIMDAPSVIRYERAYLPVRYLANALDINFEWDGDDKTLTFFIEY